MSLPTRVSDAVRRLNPHLFGGASISSTANEASKVNTPRIRQNRGPKLNKTEAAFYEYLRAKYPTNEVEPHAITLVLANGCKYTPDIVVWVGDVDEPDSTVSMYEVKGKHAWDDAIVKLKVAKRRFPGFGFWLVDRDDSQPGGWRIEYVHA